MDTATSRLLTQSGPGTALGQLLRRYWVPVCTSDEIAEPDGPQLRVQLLGERLLVFRDSAGQPGLVAEFCSHRGVSLYFGRNEEGGIRCAYHGLKFDRLGRCVEVPSAPQVCERMHIAGYPCLEKGGVVWAYMGPVGQQPEAPDLEWCQLPASHVYITRRKQACNFLQALEGGIDTAHVSYVHRHEVDGDPMHRGSKAVDYIKADGNVVFTVEQTDFGLTLFGRRKGDADTWYWRITQFLFPWHTLIPPFGEHALGGHVWVPADDHACWAWSINYRPERPLTAEELESMRAGHGIHVEYENGHGPGAWIPKVNASNDYLLDRRAQKEKRSFSGVFGISAQDYSLQESMGPIQDHAAEKLLPTDKGIVMARRMLQESVMALASGQTPPALDARAQQVRAAGVLLPRDADPLAWSRTHLAGGLHQPVYSI
jgi:phthalate 4,5-dioxygenase